MQHSREHELIRTERHRSRRFAEYHARVHQDPALAFLDPAPVRAETEDSSRVADGVVVAPLNGHVTSELSAEKYEVDVGERFDGEIGAEVRSILGLREELKESLDGGLFGGGNGPAGVVLPHQFGRCLVATYEGSLVGFMENVPVVKIDVGLTAGVGRSGVFAEWLKRLLE